MPVFGRVRRITTTKQGEDAIMRSMKRLLVLALVLGGVLVGAYQLQASGNQTCQPGDQCCPGQCEDCGSCGGCAK